MKNLIIVSHPNIQNSVVNKRWIEELQKHPELCTVHEIYKAYPDGNIDVEKEQKLLVEHDNLILQYPMYWFNCTPLLKKWLDDVFTDGWAYGIGGDKLIDKKIALAISMGVKESCYQPEGKYKATVDQFILPFRTTADYCHMNFRGYFAFYGSEHLIPERLEQNAQEYIKFLVNL